VNIGVEEVKRNGVDKLHRIDELVPVTSKVEAVEATKKGRRRCIEGDGSQSILMVDVIGMVGVEKAGDNGAVNGLKSRNQCGCDIGDNKHLTYLPYSFFDITASLHRNDLVGNSRLHHLAFKFVFLANEFLQKQILSVNHGHNTSEITINASKIASETDF
jgi:hypothetical protein